MSATATNSKLDREGRLKFLQVTEQEIQCMQEFLPHLAANLDPVFDGLYNHVAEWPGLLSKLGSQANIERIKGIQRQHWSNLFSGKFDDAYFERVTNIGRTHEHNKLEPRYYMGAYAYIMKRIIELVFQTYVQPTANGKKGTSQQSEQAAEVLKSVVSAVFLDMDLAISIYIDTFHNMAKDKLTEVTDSLSNVMNKVTQLDSNIGVSAAAVEEITTNIKQVEHNSKSVQNNVVQSNENSSMMSEKMQSMAASAEEMSTSVRNVAESIRQMSLAMNEVSSNATKASSVTAKAAAKSENTRKIVETLSQSTAQIDKVVELIKGIASQTNLLALNATIEAASAGDAGKGFAVVANEVKELAKQSATATEDIRRQVETMQTNMSASMAAIGEISEIITEIDQISNNIASAVEEQSVTINQITSNVDSVSTASRDVSQIVQEAAKNSEKITTLMSSSTTAIQDITTSMSELTTGAGEVSRTSAEVADQANAINAELMSVSNMANRTIQELWV